MPVIPVQPVGSGAAAEPEMSHSTLVPMLFAVTIPLAILMKMFVAARFYARGVLRRSLGLDDWTMIVAWVIIFANTVNIGYQTTLGLGTHLWDFDMRNYVPLAKTAFAYGWCDAIGDALVKIAVCLTYLRIFPGRTSNIYFCYSAIAYCAALGLSDAFYNTFTCLPVSDFWLPEDQPGNCHPSARVGNVITILRCVADFLVFLWPLRFLRSLHLPSNQRLQLIGLFCFGCCISGIVAFRVWFTVAYYPTIFQPDPPYASALTYLLRSVETNLCIVCGCLPFCKPALVALFPCCFNKAPTTTNAAAITAAAAAAANDDDDDTLPPRFHHAFTAPLPGLRGRKRRDSFADVSHILTMNCDTPHESPQWRTPPLIALRVLQHPPEVDLHATMASGRGSPVYRRPRQAHFGNLTAI